MKVVPITSEELFSRMVRVLFYGLKAIGLAPLSIQFITLRRNSRNTSVKVFLLSKLGVLYNLVFATLVLVIAVLAIPCMMSTKYLDKYSLLQALDLMRHIPYLFTSLFIVVYLAIRQKKAVIIMNRLLDVHFLLSGAREQSSNKRIHIFLSAQGVFHVILWATLVLVNFARSDAFLSIVVIMLVHIIIYFFCVEYSIVLGIMTKEFEIVNQNLSSLKDFPSYLFRISLPNEHLADLSTPNHSQLATLKLLHSVRTTLFELSQDISDFFSLPILLSITCIFLTLTEACYTLVISISPPTRNLSMIFIVLWILSLVIPLMLLAFNVTETEKEAKLTGRNVHKLLAAAKNESIKTELKHFSLQLIHEDVRFTAYGFFELDFTFLQSIVGATATYLVIIIQFERSANNKN